MNNVFLECTHCDRVWERFIVLSFTVVNPYLPIRQVDLITRDEPSYFIFITII